MDEVAVLGMLEAEQRSVRREGAPQEAFPVGASESHRPVSPVDDLRLAALQRDVDREAVAIGDRRRHDPRRLCESLVPSMRHAVEKRRGVAAVERLHLPAAGLVAALVLEPQHTLAVEGRNGVDEPDRMSRHLATVIGVRVEGVHLPDPGLVRDVDGVPRRGRRPLRKE